MDLTYFIVNNGQSGRFRSTVEKHLNTCSNPESSNAIIVFGGDGALLHAISNYHELEKPFIGVHSGTRGYLMNNFEDPNTFYKYLPEIEFEPAWMLEADIEGDIKQSSIYGFNDIWIERATGQTLRMCVSVDGFEQPSMLVGDGILFCTPQGSTGYNLALRGKALSPGLPVLQMTPMSCVVNKSPLGSVILSDTSEIEVLLMQTEKRPAQLFYDGIKLDLKGINNLTVRKSKRQVQLGFIRAYSFHNKVNQWQFRA